MNEHLMKMIEKKPLNQHIIFSLLAFIALLLTGLLDYSLPAANLFICYTSVIVFATLFLSTVEGVIGALISSLLNFLTNSKYLEYNSSATLIVNFIIDFLLFIFIIVLVHELRKAFLKEKNLARLDYLTGLGNRRAFIENLSARNIEFREEYSICYIDIDGFYNFIEDHGLIASDQMIKKISGFLKKYYKEVYRYEENRFIIIITEREGQKTAFSKMNVLRTELQMELFKQKLPTTLSIGIALVSQKGIKLTTIILTLFKLVQTIKKEGGNQVKYTIIKS